MINPTGTETKTELKLPRGELLPVKVLATFDDLPSGNTIRKWRKQGAPFWGYLSSREELLSWLYGRGG